MQLSFFLGAVLAFAGVSNAQRWARQLDSRQKSPPTTQSTEPCAQLAALVEPMRSSDPDAPSPVAPAELAHNCLNSAPLHKAEALGVAGSIIPYARFQSDLAFKQNPPPGSQIPPVDIIASMTKIVDNLTANVYPNEYSWQADTFKTAVSARDGHFRYVGDLLGGVARFQRKIALVSVSMDGVGLPQIYTLDDINKTTSLGQKFKPSVVAKINGVEAVSFIENESNMASIEMDSDASYNTMFFSPAANFETKSDFQYGYFGGDQRYGLLYPGPNTTLTFANGTEKVFPTVAKIIGNLTGVVDGESLYQKFCNKTGESPEATTTTTTLNQTAAPPPAFTGLPAVNNVTLNFYPPPQVASKDSQVSGYYLNKTTHPDVGVIAMQSFEPENPQEFQAVVQTMLAQMKKDGKKKLIVDLSVNGGGSVLQGFDTFRQLFPKTQDQSMARYRMSPGLKELAQATTQILPNPINRDKASIEQLVLFETHYNYLVDRNLAGGHFNATPDKFTGTTIDGNEYSNLFQFDFTDPLLTTNDTIGLGMEVTGYGSRANFTQPFPADSIVMIYDGQCASTCTLFSEMMRLQGGVKSIAFGGRPSTQQIQAIGGVKGASSNTYDELFAITNFVVQNTPPNANSSIKTLKGVTNYPQKRALDSAINIQDHILPANFKDGIPAQYVVEPADCRLFYTPAMVMDISKMWEAAADSAFKGKSCVVGGISAGMARKREAVELQKRREIIRRGEMPELHKAVLHARSHLAQARAKPKPRRIEGWKGLHGRAIPKLHAH